METEDGILQVDTLTDLMASMDALLVGQSISVPVFILVDYRSDELDRSAYPSKGYLQAN